MGDPTAPRPNLLGNSVSSWRTLGRPAWLYLAHVALLTAGLAIVGLFYNLAVLALGYPRGFLGLLTTLSLAASALASLPLWWLVTRIGLRAALLIGGLLQAASALLVALWPSVAGLVVGAVCTGCAAVLFQVSSSPFMMRHSSAAQRDHLFSANLAIILGVGGLGNLIAGSLPALLGGLIGASGESPAAYCAAFAVAGAIVMLALGPLLVIRVAPGSGADAVLSAHPPPTLHEAGQTGLLARVPEPWRSVLRQPRPLLQVLLAPFLISWGAALLIPYLNLFFKERFVIGDSTLGLIFALLGLASGLATLAAPLISARIGKLRTVVLTQALAIPFILVLGFVPMLGVAVIAALARGALFNMAMPLYDAFVMEQTDEAARPTVIGLVSVAYSVGWVIAPAISTLIQERYGYSPLFIGMAFFYTLAVLANRWQLYRKPPRIRITPGVESLLDSA